MDRWQEHDGDIHFPNGTWVRIGSTLKSRDIIKQHEESCAAYEARIAELEAQCIAERQQAAAHYQTCLVAQSRIARIAALVKPVPVAELVEAGTKAPALLAERHRQIRAILEDEG